ncbi:putative RNA exonuclease pqe-1 [Ditylenchus destructor]|nr:putative RNA exonuclease pqe-1 [Ditylenchus destructor]
MDPELQHFYDSLEQFVLSEAQLRSNGYPLWDENSKELVVIQMDYRERDSRPFLDDDCEENHHVSDSLRKGILREFIETQPPKECYTCPGVYAMDWEMDYTAWGPALGRVTLLDYQGVVVLDIVLERLSIVMYLFPFIRSPLSSQPRLSQNPPKYDERLLDTNFRYSGLKQEEVENAKYVFNQVREKFFQFVNSKSILIGHSLENDLRFLKVVHQKVVDTALVWQHPRGSHLKWSLRDLVKTMLNKDIQAGG